MLILRALIAGLMIYYAFPGFWSDIAIARQRRKETTGRYIQLQNMLGEIRAAARSFEESLRGVAYVAGKGVDVTEIVRLLQYDQWLQSRRASIWENIGAARQEAHEKGFRTINSDIDQLPSAFDEAIRNIQRLASPLRQMLGDWVSREADSDSRAKIVERLDAQFACSRVDDATGRQIVISEDRLSVVGLAASGRSPQA